MEIRQLHAHELKDAAALANRIFRENKGIPMEASFPQIFAAKGETHSFGAFDHGKLVSFIGLVPQTLQIKNATVYVFSLGSVCTDEAYRGQGISTKMLQKVYKYIETVGASLLFVSGDRGMYTRNHCYHFGHVTAYELTTATMADISYDGTIRRGEKEDLFTLHRLREEKQVKFNSSIWEWSILLEAGGIASIHEQAQQVYVAEKADEIEAYIVVGTSRNDEATTQSYVVEWAGNPQAIQAIMKEVLTKGLTAKLLYHIPWFENDQSFDEIQGNKQPHGGTVHMVNVHHFVKQMKPYMKQQNIADFSIVKNEDDIYTVTIDNDTKTLTEEQLITYLFTPNEKSDGALPIPLPNPEGLYFI